MKVLLGLLSCLFICAVVNAQDRYYINQHPGLVIVVQQPDNESDQPISLADQKDLQAVLAKWLGYAHTGLYIGPSDDTPTIMEMLKAMSSRDEEDILNEELPDGRHIVAGIRRHTVISDPNDRIALLFDKQNRLQAVALIHGICTNEDVVRCYHNPYSILTIFLDKKLKPAQIQPLLHWAKVWPADVTARNWKKQEEKPIIYQIVLDKINVGQINYVTVDASKPKSGWQATTLPAAFPHSLIPLLLPQAGLRFISLNGRFIYPEALVGSEDDLYLRQTAKVFSIYTHKLTEEDYQLPPAPDASVTLVRVGLLEDAIKLYQQHLPYAKKIEQNGIVSLQGKHSGYHYKISFFANKQAGDWGDFPSIDIHVNSWCETSECRQ